MPEDDSPEKSKDDESTNIPWLDYLHGELIPLPRRPEDGWDRPYYDPRTKKVVFIAYTSLRFVKEFHSLYYPSWPEDDGGVGEEHVDDEGCQPGEQYEFDFAAVRAMDEKKRELAPLWPKLAKPPACGT